LNDWYKYIQDVYMENIESIGIYSLIVLVAIYIYYQLYLASQDAKSLSRNLNYNLFAIVVPVILVFYATSIISIVPSRQFLITISGALFIIFLILFVFFMKSEFSKYIFNNYFIYFLITLIILVGLSLIFTLFSGRLRRFDGWVGFVSNLLFYIPCLISDFIRYLLKEYSDSSSTVIVLFLIEIGLLISYFVLVPIVYDNVYPEKKYILNDSNFLNEEIIYPQSSNPETNNFGLSFWIYLNSMPNSKRSYSEETTIFSYGSNSDSDKQYIKVSYANSSINSEEFIIYLYEQKYTIKLPLQKWNNFVFNVNTFEENDESKTIIDVFINGVLERSYTKDESLDITTNDVIKTGTSNDESFQRGGLYGAISNISYYTKPLTELAIIHDYNTLSIKNPPLDN
jgi:hypothetical protein